MPHALATKYFIPGIFLLSLGIGNILVGEYKCSQYSEVLAEISAQDELKNHIAGEISSPFRKLKMSSPAQDKLNQKIKSTKERISFYQMVKLGGALFVMLSTLCLAAAYLMYYRHKNNPIANEIFTSFKIR
ncbi:MAG: hypothetical protein IT292_11030 [Deltaproteobacteria bacterium]|nr:hypothetical protein [Deltaproteobacteria bacterium]